MLVSVPVVAAGDDDVDDAEGGGALTSDDEWYRCNGMGRLYRMSRRQAGHGYPVPIIFLLDGDCGLLSLLLLLLLLLEPFDDNVDDE